MKEEKTSIEGIPEQTTTIKSNKNYIYIREKWRNSPFYIFCQANIPFISQDFDGLNYYNLLCQLVDFLNKVIHDSQLVIDKTDELVELYNKLQSYVENYFTNLDVQEEINNKLDEMVENGQLENILLNYTLTIKVFNTHQDMINSDTLVNNMKVKTLGYYSINDGGGADYYVTNIKDDTQYQEEKDDLYITLLNNDIYPEMFGCYGDGIHDDTNNFQICLNQQKNIQLNKNKKYYITNDINLPKKTFIEGNRATIYVDYKGNREHIVKNTNWLDDNEQKNKIYLNNINFYVNSTSRQLKLIGLTDYDNITITNCQYSNNTSISYGTWFFDIYSNCKNITIDNIIVETLTDNEQLLNTCISIREYRESKKTENIRITNSTFIHNGIDETIWIDSWFGSIENILIENCLVHDKSTTDATMLWIGSNTNSAFNNGLINNCIFIKDKVNYAALKIGYVGDDDNGNCNNFILQNSILIAKQSNGSIITTSKYSTDTIINNCKILIESIYGEFTYGLISTGNLKFKNCEITSKLPVNTNVTYFWDIKDGIYDCNINVNGGRCVNEYINNIINSSIKGLDILFNAQAITNDINLNIINCNISVSNQLISRIAITTNSNILIKDCNINQSSEAILHLYEVSGNKNTRIINTNFENSNLLLTDSVEEVLTISNCTLEGKPITGIPANSEVRGACIIGTIFNSNQGHAIVRKISSGDQTSNWEEI